MCHPPGVPCRCHTLGYPACCHIPQGALPVSQPPRCPARVTPLKVPCRCHTPRCPACCHTPGVPCLCHPPGVPCRCHPPEVPCLCHTLQCTLPVVTPFAVPCRCHTLQGTLPVSHPSRCPASVTLSGVPCPLSHTPGCRQPPCPPVPPRAPGCGQLEAGSGPLAKPPWLAGTRPARCPRHHPVFLAPGLGVSPPQSRWHPGRCRRAEPASVTGTGSAQPRRDPAPPSEQPQQPRNVGRTRPILPRESKNCRCWGRRAPALLGPWLTRCHRELGKSTQNRSE